MLGSVSISDVFSSLGSFVNSLDQITTGISKWGATAADQEVLDRERIQREHLTSKTITDLRNGLTGLIGLFSPLTSAIQSAQSALISLAKSQLSQSILAETQDLQAIGSIQAASKQRLNFEESLQLFTDTKQDLAQAAAVLPFKTEDYVQTFKMSVDSISQGVIESKKGIEKPELIKEVREKGVEVSKLLTLQAKTTNTSSTMAAKVFGQFLGGRLNLQTDLFEANAVFQQTVIDEAVKLGGKKRGNTVDLSGMSIDQRYQAFVNGLRASISNEMLRALENSLDGAIEGLKAIVGDNTTGVLGFNRRFKTVGIDPLSSKEINTFFGAISAVTRPILGAITNVLSSLLKVFDPLEKGAEYLLKTLSKWSYNVGVFGSVLKSQLDFALAEGLSKVQALQRAISLALSNAFGINIKPIDISPELLIEMFQDWVVTVAKQLATALKIDKSREAIKSSMVFVVTEVLVPYLKLLGEVVVDVFKKDALAGLVLSALVFSPFLAALGSLVTVLTSSAQLIGLVFQASVIKSAGAGVGTGLATAFQPVVAWLSGFLRPLVPLLVLVGKSVLWLAAILAAIWAVYSVVKAVGDLFSVDTGRNRQDEGLTDDATPDEIRNSDSYINRRLYERGIDYTNSKTREEALKNPMNLVPLNTSTPVSATNTNTNSTETKITNYFTVNSTQDAETVAKQIMASFSGALSGVTN